MIIFLDTNIFFNNWHVKNANFKYLFNFLENTNSKMFISEIVCNEVDNKYQNELQLLKKAFNDNLKKSNSLLNFQLDFNIENLNIDYSIQKILLENTDYVFFFSYEKISNQELVKRAINKTRPFQSEDKGYRDTLIWLSFLESLLQIEKKEKIAFINNNSTDFFNKEKTDFHDDLKKDIENLGIIHDFNVYDSVVDFISKEVDTNKHIYTNDQIMDQFIYPYERQIENDMEDFINSQSNSSFAKMIENAECSSTRIDYLNNFNFNIIEGIEDPELINWLQIDKDVFFAELYLEFRIVELEFTIPLSVYISQKQLFDSQSYNIEIENNYVTLYQLLRVSINFSCNYNIPESRIKDIVINHLKLKIT